MKLFTLSDDLIYREVSRSYIRLRTTVIVCAFLVISGLIAGYCNAPVKDKIINKHSHSSNTDTVYADNDFSKEKFVQALYESNVKYPHIVMAQAIIESGNFTSSIFRHNNNMFGMRKARSRVTTCIGEANGFATYRNWRDCIYDYALYQYSVMNNCDTEEKYLRKLEEKYAQDTSYIAALKAAITNQNLKSLFDE